jgi:hypothetical protein
MLPKKGFVELQKNSMEFMMGRSVKCLVGVLKALCLGARRTCLVWIVMMISGLRKGENCERTAGTENFEATGLLEL